MQIFTMNFGFNNSSTKLPFKLVEVFQRNYTRNQNLIPESAIKMKKYISTLCLILFVIVLTISANSTPTDEDATLAVLAIQSEAPEPEVKLNIGISEYLGQAVSEEEKELLIAAFTLEEPEVYTFLQGPRSWEEGVAWSGEWCLFSVKGNSFGNFGCGLCCVANIYDTLSPYEVSPWDMCEYAREVSGYAPKRKSGAIDWGNMKEVLKKCGCFCDVYYKPDSYEVFQQQMAQAKSAVVLVSSAEDDTYWKDTSGHYVNIWLYQEEDDTVFLAEPGNPDNNRSRIPLRYVYDALKTTSKFQYLLVDEYREEENQWKADGIDESWNRP